MRGDRRLPPGERRRGFVLPIPRTRAGKKTALSYIQTLRSMVHEIAESLEIQETGLRRSAETDAIGAIYLAAFLDNLADRLREED
ncbi:MAG: hypothetical protein QN198_06325 [Armatimonadota bacterium]|nr:hypothetical protein [Armatimonadota bacterium]MDR5703201.1 hypothetical protein [Armatimonadota bacterium]MDR7435520.1 hypothetical protein [Armatimonadota bacterium]